MSDTHNLQYYTAFTIQATPDFDGFYLLQLEETQPCGNVTISHKVVECRNNKWLLDEKYTVAAWMPVPKYDEEKGLSERKDRLGSKGCILPGLDLWEWRPKDVPEITTNILKPHFREE